MPKAKVTLRFSCLRINKSIPLCYREIYGEGVIKSDGHIDMERYISSFNDKDLRHYLHRCDFHNVERLPDSRGQLQGPVDLASCVKEWIEIEAKTNVRLYFEIMPHLMQADQLRDRAIELYDAGATRFGLWDSN